MTSAPSLKTTLALWSFIYKQHLKYSSPIILLT